MVSQPESEALAAASAFMHLFLPVLALAILMVIMLSVTQIRRTLVPLERLIDGTRRIAAQDFGDRIDIARTGRIRRAGGFLQHYGVAVWANSSTRSLRYPRSIGSSYLRWTWIAC